MKQHDEWRTVPGDVEVREIDGRRVLVGYAAKFATRSENLGGFVEMVAPSAFNKTVQEADVVALRDHKSHLLLGRRSAGTLRLVPDGVGLRYEVDIDDDTSAGRDTASMVRRRDLIGSSFGFRTIDDDWDTTEDGYPLRILNEVALRDVGPVTFPAYSATEVALRSLATSSAIDLRELVDAAAADRLTEKLSATEEEDEAADQAPVRIHRPARH